MKRLLTCGNNRRTHVLGHWNCTVLTIAAVVTLMTGCTRIELETKADAYNAAIAESNNRQILLNAVRASQRAPMSFVGFGDMAAQPNLSGSAAGTFNFDPFGLTTYTINPTLNANGGFTNFQMSNLNSGDFMMRMQQPLNPKLVQHFSDLKFPDELIQLVFVQQYIVPRGQYDKIIRDVKAKCAEQDPRTVDICGRLAADHEALLAAGCQEFAGSGLIISILNTGRELCSMITFQVFVRQLRLLRLKLPFKTRTPEGMLYWLGELIAAQNYSVHPYVPEFYVETPDGRRRLVPLFVVLRGPPVGPVAVVVNYHDDVYYIPQPAFGTIEEARSLQVLDLVSQAVVAATTKGDLPKSTTVTLVPAR